MSALQRKYRSNNRGNTSENCGSIGRAFIESSYKQDSIKQANFVLLSQIFKYYNINFDDTNKTTCPFSQHNDKSASFVFYKDTNTFYCFGCQTGFRCVDFVSKIDGTSKNNAAKKILSLFDGQIIDFSDNFTDAKEKLKILNSFSNEILNFKKKFFDKQSRQFIEDLCMIYDDIHYNNSLNNEALRSMTDLFIVKIKKYSL